MKFNRILLILAAVAALVLFVQATALADDGAALFKTKCAICHGANAEGKPAMKAPALKSPDVKKMSDADLTSAIAEGGKAKKATHAFGAKGVTPDQVKALVGYIKDLNK